jgi:hypothetical protein
MDGVEVTKPSIHLLIYSNAAIFKREKNKIKGVRK